MREINKSEVSKELVNMLDEKNPIDEDIAILDVSGSIVGVIITNDAYQFFLKKIEEEEDKIDSETVNDFHKSGEKDK